MGHSNTVLDLIVNNNFKRIAEIGVHKGNTARTILCNCESVEEYWGIDPYMSYEQMEEDWDLLYRKICLFMIDFPQFKIVRLLSSEAFMLFPEKYFDLVFIDGNHNYHTIKNDISLWRILVREGGIICGHDYKEGGKFPFWGVHVAVNEIFKPEEIETLPNRIFAVRL